MLKLKVVEYRLGGGGFISSHMEADIMQGFMSSVGFSGSVIKKALQNNIDPTTDEAKINYICHQFEHKIMHVEFIEELNFGVSTGPRYGIIYDDEIEATYEENYETVEQQFVMNKL